MRPRLVTVALLGAAVLFVAASPAGAEERPGGSGGAYVNPDGDPTAVAADGASQAGSGDQTSGSRQCEWIVLVDDDVKYAIYEERTRLYSETGRWLQYVCPPQGAIAVGGRYLIPEGGLVDPSQVAVDALASVSIEPPPVHTSPSADGRLYVQVPTWLWVDPNWWRPYEATARAGRVWATVRATPVTVTWTMGDGRTVTCRGPGTEWRSGAPEDASTCTHTYRGSSAGRPEGRFVVEATVTFEVSWTSNVSAGGTLPAISRTQSLDVVVGEIQAIGTRGVR
ncbi:MAG: hypothetical protein AMXMBFR46_20820 [Acidimicrobiia bacterium]